MRRRRVGSGDGGDGCVTTPKNGDLTPSLAAHTRKHTNEPYRTRARTHACMHKRTRARTLTSVHTSARGARRNRQLQRAGIIERVQVVEVPDLHVVRCVAKRRAALRLRLAAVMVL